jgi:hypothetical protein
MASNAGLADELSNCGAENLPAGAKLRHAVAAREDLRDAGPVNREPTAWQQVAAGIPPFRAAADVKVGP